MRLALLLGPLLLASAGCVSVPIPRPDESLPAAWRHESVPPAAADLKGWWQGFEDPALDALVARALNENLGLRAAAERLQAARLLRAHANDAYQPYLRVHTEDAINPSASAAYVVTGLDASWEFPLFGRAEATRRMTQADADDAAAVLDGVRVSLVAEVVADYLLLGAGQERLTLLTRTREMNEQQFALVKKRSELALASMLDVGEAQATLARTRAAEASAQQQLNASGAQLAALLGLTAPESGWLRDGPPVRLKVSAIPEAPAELLRTRPEIRRAEAAVLAAAGAELLAQADRYPSVGLVGSIRGSSILTQNRTAPSFNIASIGPSLDIPLFDWGMRRARANSRAHLLNAAVLDYREAVLRGVAEVETALGGLQRDTLRETSAQEVADSLQQAAASASRRTELQLASPVMANSAGLAALEAQLVLIDARTERGMSYVALYKALGGAPRPSGAP